MNTPDLIGLGLALLGIIIFLFVALLSKRFRQYAGIKEYKKIREKYLPNKEEEEPEEEEPELGTTLTSIIGRLVGSVIALYVFSEVTGTLLDTPEMLNVTTPFAQSFGMIKGFVPVMGILMGFHIIYDFLKWKKTI